MLFQRNNPTNTENHFFELEIIPLALLNFIEKNICIPRSKIL
jgi:hypothetical protein